MSVQEKAIIGAQLFLRGLPDEQLTQLAGACRHITVPVGQRLFEEGTTASRFWLIDAGQVALDAMVPGQGRLIVEMLGRGDVIGLSWLVPPHQWRFGAVTTQPMQAFEFDARAVRAACDSDPALGYELSRRFSQVLVRRLQATRSRLLDACLRSPAAP
jgi:CRP/FNR family transcriptional regulator, cyclic AMP receptor protein